MCIGRYKKLVLTFIWFAVFPDIVLTSSHITNEQGWYNANHEEAATKQDSDRQWYHALSQGSHATEEKYEISFKGECKPFEDGNSSLLHFWSHFLDKISMNLNISRDGVKANDLFLCKPIRLTFTLVNPPADINFVKGVELMIQDGLFIISIPEGRSNYSAIGIKRVTDEDVTDNKGELSRLYVILIVCAASIFTVSISILLCTRITKRKHDFRPNGQPAVKYSMKEVLQIWEKREKGKQTKEETLSRADTMEMTEKYRPSGRKQTSNKTRTVTEPPPIIVPEMKE